MDRKLGLPAIALFAFAGGLSLAAGIVLWLFPDRTAAYFAWTIGNPLTAMHMGASYLAGAGTIAALRAGNWAAARVQVPFMIVFGTLQLLATLLHLDSFNFAHPLAWGWIIVYAVSPFAALTLFIYYESRYTSAVYLREPSTPPLLLAILALATVHILAGAALFIVPQVAAPFWPWQLTPLTARVLAGWYVAGGVSVWMRVRQPASPVGQIGQVAGFVVAPLLLFGALRFRADFSGPPLAIGLYLLDVVLAGVLLAFASLRGRRAI